MKCPVLEIPLPIVWNDVVWAVATKKASEDVIQSFGSRRTWKCLSKWTRGLAFLSLNTLELDLEVADSHYSHGSWPSVLAGPLAPWVNSQSRPVQCSGFWGFSLCPPVWISSPASSYDTLKRLFCYEVFSSRLWCALECPYRWVKGVDCRQSSECPAQSGVRPWLTGVLTALVAARSGDVKAAEEREWCPWNNSL